MPDEQAQVVNGERCKAMPECTKARQDWWKTLIAAREVI